MKEYLLLLQSGILAGLSIAMGCVVYLNVGGVAGACLFSFGLLTCVHFALKLYTGTAGFANSGGDLIKLLVILAANILGCLVMALVMNECNSEIADKAVAVIDRRLGYTTAGAMMMSVFCGFIMTTAVKFAREGRFLPLLFGVPLFILCGFIHSIADAFYILACPIGYLSERAGDLALFYPVIVLGNFIGCNLYRIVMLRRTYPA